MGNWCICVLANNMRYFHVMMSNIPDELRDVMWYVFNDDRLGDLTQQLESELAEAGIEWYEVVKATDINDEFSQLVEDRESIDSYCLSTCILFLWYMGKHFGEWDRLLYVDDDVIFTQDAAKLFSIDHCSFFTRDGLMKAKLKNKYFKPLAEAMMGIQEKKFKFDEFRRSYVSTCAFIIDRSQIDFKKYEDMLVKFFNDPVIFDYARRGRKATSFHTDELFMTAFVQDNGLLDGEFTKHIAFVIEKVDKIKDITMQNWFKLKSLIHIGNVNWKDATYDRLVAAGLIEE